MGGKWRRVPGFEVDDNQRTNKESSPVNTGPSEDTVSEEMILLSSLASLVHLQDSR